MPNVNRSLSWNSQKRRIVTEVSPEIRTSNGLRVISYNVLAEIYATRSMYSYAQQWTLLWNFRRRLILRELDAFDADIICLQEVQADHFEHFFYPQLKARGYEGSYKQKTREPMGVKGKVDGCALFFRVNRLKLKENYVFEFNTAALASANTTEAEAAAAVSEWCDGHGVIIETVNRVNPMCISQDIQR